MSGIEATQNVCCSHHLFTRMHGQVQASNTLPTSMELIIIAAMAIGRVIGSHNTIPWQIPEDMAHFKAVTMGYPVILGRRTYESIGGPLPGRQTIVVTANPSFHPHPDCTVAASLTEAIRCCQGADKVFIAGGVRLYREALARADTLILTVIDHVYQGDTFFPDFSDSSFVLTSSQPLAAAVPVRIETYHRRIAAETGTPERF
jgi:dihydrofolate reductase